MIQIAKQISRIPSNNEINFPREFKKNTHQTPLVFQRLMTKVSRVRPNGTNERKEWNVMATGRMETEKYGTNIWRATA